MDAPSEAADLRALLNEASRPQPADEIIAVKRHTWCGAGPPDPRDAGVLLSAGNIASSGSRPTGPAYLTAFGAYAVTGEQAALELFTAADQYRQRRRCGADPVLAARGEGVLRPAGAGVLWPCRRSVFDQGPVAAAAPMPRAAWEQLPRTLRAFAVGRGIVPESTPAPAPVSAPGSGANGPAPPPTHEGALHVVVPLPGGLDPVRSTRDCGAGPEFTDCDAFPNMGCAFDAWSERLYLATSDGIYRVGVWGTDPTQPAANNLGWALPDVGAVHLPANRLAFKGYVHDFSLFWARVALQHAFDRDDTSFLLGAHVYARGALTELVDYGRILIHEMGHLFIGFGGHCECVKSEIPCACCFDIAAERWKCRVASRLGLPNGFWQCAADPLTVSHANPCGGEGAAYGLICWRHELCVPGDVANFATGTCT